MNITLIVAVAILIEGLVEYGKSIAAMFNGKDTRTGITQIVTIVIGVVLHSHLMQICLFHLVLQ